MNRNWLAVLYEPLHHKYRPQTFAQLVGQSAIADTLTHALEQNRIAPAYLFCGPRGTGKTSSARILAKSLNCLNAEGPTPKPCGKCDLCLSVSRGNALDIVEIDAASNTGVDNIRELIERAQFAPVQCRYKAYVIDECLTGDTQIVTESGLCRIDDQNIVGQKVLSYNEKLSSWEYKKAIRWFDQGKRQTYTITTNQSKIRCTGNHLIRTEFGWIAAKDVKEGTKILSPANSAAPQSNKQPCFAGKGLVSSSYRDPHSLGLGHKAPTYASQPEVDLLQGGVPVGRGGSAHEATRRPVLNAYYSQSHQWNTNLEVVESVELSDVERVYDIEVEDNHNFVANGLLVHNCHMLSTAAFNALLKTLEEPPDRVVFVLATTDPQRVLPTIISRCQRFDFRRIPLPAMIKHLTYIAKKEQINIAESALQLVAQISQGGLRDAESLLDQLSLQADEITVETVWDLVGAVPERDLLNLVRAIAADDGTVLIDRVRNLMDKGREPLIVLQSLVGFYRDLLIAKTAPKREDLVAITPSTWTELTEFAQKLPAAQILASQQKLQTSEVQVKNTTQPRLWLEITLTSLLPSALGAVAALIEGQAPVNAVSVPAAPVASSPGSFRTAAPQPSAPAPAATPPPSVPATSSPPPQNTDESRSAAPAQSVPEPPESTSTTPDDSPTNAEAPSSQPVKPTPEPPPAVDPAFGSLSDLWKRILAALEPRGTQMLMGQQGILLAFDGVGAKVGFKSASLQKMARERVPNLEKALASIFNRPIKVSLEVVSKEEADASQSNSQSNPQPSASPPLPSSAAPTSPPPPVRPSQNNAPSDRPNKDQPAANPTSDRTAPSDTNAPNSGQEPTQNNSNAGANQAPDLSPQNGSPQSDRQEPPAKPVDNLPSAASSAVPGQWQTNQEQDNIKRFAQFFNGQIVELDDDIDPMQSDPNKTQKKKKSSEPGPDVPF